MFINSLKFLLRLSFNSLFEDVSQTSLAAIGDNTMPSFSSGGYLMQNDQYLFGDGVSSNGYNLGISDQYTIGFWLYSINPGVAVDANSGNLLSIEMPLLVFSDNSSAEHSIIEFTEHAQFNGNNILRIKERNNYTVFSEEYESNKWHYFWITRRPEGLKIFIDGIENSLQDEVGVLPNKVAEGLELSWNIYINHSLDGYDVNVAKNKGTIDDIFVLNTYDQAELDIQRIINNGVVYVVDDFYTTTNVPAVSIFMNDSETITINSMIDDLSYVFVGRNDGKILRGSALFWEVRKSFSDEEEYLTGGLSLSEDSKHDDGFLELNKMTIRL